MFTGDSGQKLSEEEFYRNLPVPTVPFGVIAGDKGQRLTFNEPNDAGCARRVNQTLWDDGLDNP